MSTIRLTKHHGLGNDFLVAFDRGAFAGSDVPELARRWCHRRRGIGADGLLLAATGLCQTWPTQRRSPEIWSPQCLPHRFD